MCSKLYKLALWYIGKCNTEWNKYSYTEKVKSLDRLTYWNFGKYMLLYGADAEWQNFGRYEVLDNAIQKLAKYENDEQEIRNKAIEEFAEAIKTSQDAHTWCCNDLTLEFCVGDDCKECLEKFKARIDEIAESMKGEK